MPDPQVSTRDDRHVYGWMIIGMSLVIAALAVVVRTSDLPVATPAPVSNSRAGTTTTALLVRGTIAAQVGKAGQVDIAIGITNPGGAAVTATEAAVKITPVLDTPAIHFTTGLPTQALKGGDGPDSIAVAGHGTAVLVTEFHLNCEQVRAGQTQTLSVTVQALGSDGVTQAIDLTPDQFSLNALVWTPACR